MIRFLQHDQIDKKQWDVCISRAVNGNFLAWYWFLDIVNPEWCALVDDNYEKVFPLTAYAKAGIKYLRQPYFTQQLGVFYQTSLTQEELLAFLHAIPPTFKYIYIYLNASNRIASSGADSEMTNLELDLNSEYGLISRSYHTNLQRNLKKAQKHNLSISKHIKPEAVISLFKDNKGKEIKHLEEASYQLVERIASESIHRGMGEIWGAYDEFNKLIAGVLWIKSHQKAVFLFSAVSSAGKKTFAMPYLIDAFIRQNAGLPLILDFEGSNDAGLARFYSGFGARKVLYQRYISNNLPFILRSAMKIWQLTRKQIKKIT